MKKPNLNDAKARAFVRLFEYFLSRGNKKNAEKMLELLREEKEVEYENIGTKNNQR